MNKVSLNSRHQPLNGTQKTAVMFLCLGEDLGSVLMQMLESAEIHSITKAIADMGLVPAELVDTVMQEFEIKIGEASGVTGSSQIARNMLGRFLPEDRVISIMDEIETGKTGNIWADISALETKILADYLRREHKQTIAVILSKLSADQVANVLPLLGDEEGQEVVERMANMSELPQEILEDIESSLRRELLANETQRQSSKAEGHLVSVFNKLDSKKFNELTRKLERKMPEKIKSIKMRMFLFEDMSKLTANVLALIMREAGRNTIPLALRGASKETREHFLISLPQRSRDMLKEEMTSMGPVKARDVKAAQSELVGIATTLADNGQIELPSETAEEDMID